ncbi:MAG: Ig-like domain-containing protein [Vallitalea sp.]|nr:Ig-like domain-containing protein [Vallitalea sp.]
MKKAMRKLVAFALAAIVLFSNAPNAFANTVTNEDKVNKLVQLNVLQGEGNGVDSTKTMTRYRSIVMMLRLKGLEADMMAYDYVDKDTFADADGQNGYQQRLMAYIKNNPQLGVIGYPDGTFRPYQEITTKEYVKVLVDALGYDYTWDTVADVAVMIGLADSTADVNTTDTFKVANFADYTYDGLTMKAKGDDVSFGEKLGYPIVVTKFTISSIKPINLVQTEIKFNSEVDSTTSEKLANYSIKDKNNNNVAITDASLLNDEKTIILTHAKINQQENAIITVKNVKNLNTTKTIADTTSDELQYLDITLPSAIKAEVIGNDTIKVTFSEPISAGTLVKSNFDVNGGKLYIKSVTPLNNNTEANVELYSDLSDGQVSIYVSNKVEDEASFGVIPTTLTATVSEDTNAPKVIGYKDASPNGVTLIFNEEIELKAGAKANFYHTNSNNLVDNDVTSNDINGNELKLSFTDANLPQGIAYVYILKGSINDLWDNANSQVMIKVDVELDVTSPEVDGDIEIVSEEKIVIDFTEALVDASKSNFTILDENGKEVKDIIDSVTLNTDKITINFDSKLNGTYTIVIEDLKDLASNIITTSSIQFVVDDLTKPVSTKWSAKLYNAGASDQMVKIDFNEKMATSGKYSVLDIEKYTVDGNQLADIDDVTFTLVDNGTAIEINIPNAANNGVDLTSGNDKIVTARIADASGNYTATLTNTFNLDSQGNVNIESVVAKDTLTVEVTFGDELVEFDATDLVITTNNSDAASADSNKLDIGKVTTALNADNKTVATFTLVEADKLSHDLSTDVYAYVVNTQSNNKYTETLSMDHNKMATDKIAPELEKIDVSGNMVNDVQSSVVTNPTGVSAGDYDVVTLTFTEDIKASSLSILTFEVEDYDVLAFNVTSNVIQLVLNTDANATAPETGIKVTQKAPIHDLKGNAVDSLTVKVEKAN